MIRNLSGIIRKYINGDERQNAAAAEDFIARGGQFTAD